MKKRQIALWLLQVALAALLASLQFLDQDSGGTQAGFLRSICVFLFQHRLLLSIALTVSLTIVTGWKTLLYPRKKAKEIRQRIMQTMLDELFDGDKKNHRITIFKNAKYFRRLIIYWKQLEECFRNLRRGQKMIRPKMGKYVYVWERLGTEHSASKTFFYYDPQTAKTCQGVAGAVMQGLSDIIVQDLPDLEHIDLATVNLNNNKLLATKAVKQYMKEGSVDDFEALKRIHKHARHIYGNILDNDGPKGVLVIDSFLATSFLNEQAVISKLSHYAIIIGATM